MFRSYFKIAFRNLARNRSYTLINIAGLAVGIGVCLMIFQVIQYHVSYDNFHHNKDRIYRVLTEYHHADAPDIFYGSGVPRPMPHALKTEFPQLEQVASIYSDYNVQLLMMDQKGETAGKFKVEHGVFYTEPSFFSIFNYPLLAGSYQSLKDPGNVLLEKETAEEYFGNWKNAIGKTIRINNTDMVKVSGILQSIPPNSDFQLKVVIAYGTGITKDIDKSTNWDGTSSDFGCYIMLPPDISVAGFNQQLRAFSKRMESPENMDSHIIQPLRDVHFDTKIGSFGGKLISRQLINALWMIASFILLIACVNFINLSTALAVNRAKEVGIRKVMGSRKWQIGLQFLIETFLIVLFSVLIAILVNWAFMPGISKLMDLELHFTLLKNETILLFLILVLLIVTALAGFYPALVLSGYNPVNALKSKVTALGSRGISLRRALVVFQFIIAQVLIIGTIIIVRQLNYFTGQPLGFEKDAIVNIPFPTDSANISKLDFLRKQLTESAAVQNVSFSSNTPIEDNNDEWTTFKFDRHLKDESFYAIFKFADHEYVPVYKLTLVAGRNLEASDTLKELLVNESFVRGLGIKNPVDVLNKEVAFSEKLKGTIVGVVKDFNDRSFRAGLAPVIITTIKSGYSEAGIKLSMRHLPDVIKNIEHIWNTVYPDFVFEYKFLDKKIEEFYKQEALLSHLYKIFASIALFLSCLGLFGLASFLTVQRTKEVGIRKVLGASVQQIVYLFSKEYMLLILLAFLISLPIAWYYMNNWLNDYAYRIPLDWWLFIAGGLVSLLIALITISTKALKAALANPVKSLRTE